MPNWRNWIEQLGNSRNKQTETDASAPITDADSDKPLMTDGSGESPSDEERTHEEARDDDVASAAEAHGSGETGEGDGDTPDEPVTPPTDDSTPDQEVPPLDKAEEIVDEMSTEERVELVRHTTEVAVDDVGGDGDDAGTAAFFDQQKTVADIVQDANVEGLQSGMHEEARNDYARETLNRDTNRTYSEDDAMDEDRFLDNHYDEETDFDATLLERSVVPRLSADDTTTADLADEAGSGRSLGEVPEGQYEHRLVLDAIHTHENFGSIVDPDDGDVTSIIEHRATVYELADDVAAATEDEIQQTVREAQMAPTEAKKHEIESQDRRLLRDYDRLLTDMDQTVEQTAETIDSFYEEEIELADRLHDVQQEMAEMLGQNGLLHEISVDLRMEKNQGFSTEDQYKPETASTDRLDQWYDALDAKMDRLGDGFSSGGMLDDIVSAANRFHEVVAEVDQYDDALSVDQPDQLADHERLDSFAAEVTDRSDTVAEYTQHLNEALDAGYLHQDARFSAGDQLSLSDDVEAVATYTQEIVDARENSDLNDEATYERVSDIVTGNYQVEVDGQTVDPLPDVHQRLA